MTKTFDPAPAATRLAHAWHTRTRLAHLPQDERPTTLEQGYAIQDALRAALGEEVGGYKVAAANADALRASEFGQALFGYMGRTRMHASGVTLARVEGAMLTLEVELAFSLARDVAPAHEPLGDAGLFADGFLAAEIVCSRYVDRKVVGAASFVADGSAFHAFVRGDRLPVDSDVAALPASLVRDGQAITHALSGGACTQPRRSLELFWAHAAARGIRLAQGQVITTGTLVQPVDVHEPGEYEGRIGDARVRFTLR